MRYNTKSTLRNRNRNITNNKTNRVSKRKPAKRTNSKNKRSRVRRRTVKGGAASEGCGDLPEITVTKKSKEGEDVIETKCALRQKKENDTRILTRIRVPKLFADNKEIISVELGPGIKIVDKRAFNLFENLKTVVLNEDLEKIEEAAFAHSGVETINLPNSLKKIGENAFQGCTSLTRIEIPGSVESIGNGAFSECSGLNTLIINCPPPGQTLKIDSQAFYKCTKLSSIEFIGDGPGTIKIDQDAFSECCPQKSGIFSKTKVKLPTGQGKILIIGDESNDPVSKSLKK